MKTAKNLCLLFVSLCYTTLIFAQTPHIISTSPAQNELNVSADIDISATFNIDMDENTINNNTFVVNARSTGLHEGIF